MTTEVKSLLERLKSDIGSIPQVKDFIAREFKALEEKVETVIKDLEGDAEKDAKADVSKAETNVGEALDTASAPAVTSATAAATGASPAAVASPETQAQVANILGEPVSQQASAAGAGSETGSAASEV